MKATVLRVRFRKADGIWLSPPGGSQGFWGGSPSELWLDLMLPGGGRKSMEVGYFFKVKVGGLGPRRVERLLEAVPETVGIETYVWPSGAPWPRVAHTDLLAWMARAGLKPRGDGTLYKYRHLQELCAPA